MKKMADLAKKIVHSVSQTFFCHFKSATNYAEFFQICEPFAYQSALKK
jgi:hypothetical protein